MTPAAAIPTSIPAPSPRIPGFPPLTSPSSPLYPLQLAGTRRGHYLAGRPEHATCIICGKAAALVDGVPTGPALRLGCKSRNLVRW